MSVWNCPELHLTMSNSTSFSRTSPRIHCRLWAQTRLNVRYLMTRARGGPDHSIFSSCHHGEMKHRVISISRTSCWSTLVVDNGGPISRCRSASDWALRNSTHFTPDLSSQILAELSHLVSDVCVRSRVKIQLQPSPLSTITSRLSLVFWYSNSLHSSDLPSDLDSRRHQRHRDPVGRYCHKCSSCQTS